MSGGVDSVVAMRDLEPREADIAADARLRARLADGTHRQTNDGGWCECGECGRIFAGITYFNAHRPNPASNAPCLDPYVGMEQDDAASGSTRSGGTLA